MKLIFKNKNYRATKHLTAQICVVLTNAKYKAPTILENRITYYIKNKLLNGKPSFGKSNLTSKFVVLELH